MRKTTIYYVIFQKILNFLNLKVDFIQSTSKND